MANSERSIQQARRDDLNYRQQMLVGRINRDADVIERMNANGSEYKALFEAIAAIARDIAEERRQVGY